MIVGSPACRKVAVEALANEGLAAVETDCPYLAMAELSRKPMAYRTLVLSLQSLYIEELAIIPAVKKDRPQIEIWLSQTDGRPAALAEALRLGADGLLAEDGLHRLSSPEKKASPSTAPMRLQDEPTPLAAPPTDAWQRPIRPAEPNPLLPPSPETGRPVAATDRHRTDRQDQRDQGDKGDQGEQGIDGWPMDSSPMDEPILTADELRALLQEPSGPIPPLPD